jgi:hypothetical protein
MLIPETKKPPITGAVRNRLHSGCSAVNLEDANHKTQELYHTNLPVLQGFGISRFKTAAKQQIVEHNTAPFVARTGNSEDVTQDVKLLGDWPTIRVADNSVNAKDVGSTPS